MISFSVLIHQSITHPGQYLLSIINKDDETLLLSRTDDLKSLMDHASECFGVDDGEWEYNTSLKCYTLKIGAATA